MGIVIIDGIQYVPKGTEISKTNNVYEKALNSIIKETEIGNNITIRYFMYKLMSKLFADNDDFSSKRPLGNGVWKYQIYEVLIKEKFIYGSLDEDGIVETLNEPESDEFIQNMIRNLFQEK